MSDLDEIRRKRMAELEDRQAAAQGQMQQQAQQQMQQQEAQRQFEEQKKALIATKYLFECAFPTSTK